MGKQILVNRVFSQKCFISVWYESVILQETMSGKSNKISLFYKCVIYVKTNVTMWTKMKLEQLK